MTAMASLQTWIRAAALTLPSKVDPKNNVVYTVERGEARTEKERGTFTHFFFFIAGDSLVNMI